jgi:hypothetical protein
MFATDKASKMKVHPQRELNYGKPSFLYFGEGIGFAAYFKDYRGEQCEKVRFFV